MFFFTKKIIKSKLSFVSKYTTSPSLKHVPKYILTISNFLYTSVEA